MNSKRWNSKNPSNIPKISRKINNIQSQSFLFAPHRPQPEDSSLFVMKIDLLTKKLGKKTPYSPLIYSRYSYLKSTKCPQLVRADISQDSSRVDLKIRKENMETNHDNELDQIEEKCLQYEEKNKEIRQYEQIHTSQISSEIQQIHKILRKIGQRSSFICPVKKQYQIFSDLLKTPNKESLYLLSHKLNSKKQTLNSADKEPSLLLSFKKNMEDDDGYVTLKYSEQSVSKEPNDTLMQGWQSYQKDRSRVRKKIEAKQVKESCIIPEQIQQQYFLTIQDTILEHLSVQKRENETTYKESQQVLNKFQNILNQLVEQIAEEKVQSEYQWKALQKNANQEIDYLSYNIEQLKKESYQYEDQVHSKIRQIQKQFLDRLSCQKCERKLQEKLMIKMMTDIVQCFK